MATLESRACPGRYSNEQARGHGIRDWRTMNDWIFCHLQQCARKAEQAWFLIDLDNGYLGWVHRDVACEHPTCPMAGVRHRHVATPHERERTQTLYVTPWLEECWRRSEAAAGRRADVEELWRIWRLSPEPFYCNFELQRRDEQQGACAWSA